MIKIKFETEKFFAELKNITGYAEGFMQGVESGEKVFAENLGKEAIEDLKEFIDANARLSPETMHHVYEWYLSGSPDARLFDIEYEASSSGGLSIYSTFRQSVSVRNGSTTPFYNKAEIMENGIPVIIKPVRAQALVFEDDGFTVFTKGPVKVTEPGGDAVQGSYERVFEAFFNTYFTQSFLQHSQVMQKLKQATPFYTNFSNAKRGGRAVGVSTGRRWISGGVV